MGDIIMRNPSTTPIHVMALDGIVNVNSLFTLAMFLGIVNADPTNPSYTFVTSSTSECSAHSSMAEDLIVYHVYSFCSFLFSSLIASALKQAIKATHQSDDNRDEAVMARVSASYGSVVHVNTKILRVGILACTSGSVFGCGFLMLALVNLVQIKFGIFACHNAYTLAACIPLLVLVPLGLILYICVVLHAFTS